MREICETCSKTFKDKAALNFHRKRLHGEKDKVSNDYQSQPLVSDGHVESESAPVSNAKSKGPRVVTFSDELQEIYDLANSPFLVRLCGSRQIVRENLSKKPDHPVKQSKKENMESVPNEEGESEVISRIIPSTSGAGAFRNSSQSSMSSISSVESESKIPPRGHKRKKPEERSTSTSTPNPPTEHNAQEDVRQQLPSPSSSRCPPTATVTPSRKQSRREGSPVPERTTVPPPPALVSDDAASSVSSAPSSVPSAASAGGADKVCSACGKTGFRNTAWYMNHLEIHEGKRPFVCPTCEKGYETPEKLLEHVTRAHSETPFFKCENEECGKEYKTKRGLDKHRCVQSS